MLRTCLVSLAVVGTAATSYEAAIEAAQAHAVTLARLGSGPTPNPLCIVSKCGGKAFKCGIDKNCRSALLCTAGCGGTNQTCIFQCTSDFEGEVYDDLLYCMFNENDCMGTKKGFDEWQACRPMEDVAPMKEYRGAPMTKEVARNILMRGTQHRGDWMVAQGKSHAYDCFDCQFLYWGFNSDKTMYYEAYYKIHKSDGGQRWNDALYVASEWEDGIGRFSMNASNYGGLAHEEDWRLLAADESDSPQWIAMYYCGAAAGVGEAYEGAFILTPDGNLPTDAKAMASIDAVYKKANITLQCKTDNSDCAGRPAPPNGTMKMLADGTSSFLGTCDCFNTCSSKTWAECCTCGDCANDPDVAPHCSSSATLVAPPNATMKILADGTPNFLGTCDCFNTCSSKTWAECCTCGDCANDPDVAPHCSSSATLVV